MRVLNLYAGIGGNRWLWEDVKVTAVELDSRIADVYENYFPYDEVVVGDACDYLEKNYRNFDFIWASPPCQTHSRVRHQVGVLSKRLSPVIADMKSLYGVITFLKTYAECQWVVENVIPYYKVLIEPTVQLTRHLFWSSFPIPKKRFPKKDVKALHSKTKLSEFPGSSLVYTSHIENKRQVLRNCVERDLGLYVLNCAREVQ